MPSVREACGFLLGTEAGQNIEITCAVPVINAVARYGGFAIADHERRRVERLANKLNLKVVAFYHSHPRGNGQLSEADRQWLSNSKFPWII